VELVRRDAIGVARLRGDEEAMDDDRMTEIKAFARAVRSESIAATLYDNEIERGVRATVGDPSSGFVERGVPAYTAWDT